MAEELIDSYVDRAGVKGDTDFILSSLREVYTEFKKLESVKIDLKGAAGLAQIAPSVTSAKAGLDSLATATETVRQRIAQMNGSSKEFTNVLLAQLKAQKEAANVSAAQAKADAEAAKAKGQTAKAAALEAKAMEQTAKAKQAEIKITEQQAKASTADLKLRDQIRKESEKSAAALRKSNEELKNFGKTTEQSAKAQAAEAKMLEQATNDYLQLSKAYNDAALKAKNYFVVLGENHPVTQQAVKDADAIGQVLKKADYAVGQFQRNVGNYKSAWDGLGFSFTQVARELPSLAVSVQTFALAISNNLPMVFDELQKAKNEIAALKAEGKDAPTLGQRLKQAFFSPQLALSLLITGVTLFAGRLFNATDNSKALKEATDKLKDSFDREKESIQGVIDTLKDYTEIDILNLKARGATDQKVNERRILGEEQTLKELQDLEQSALDKRNEARKKADDISGLLKIRAARSIVKKQVEIAEAEAKTADEEYRKRKTAVEKQEREIVKLKAEIRADDAEKQRDDAKDNADKLKDLADKNAQASLGIEEVRLQRIIDFNREIADDEANSLAKRAVALQYAREAEIELAIRQADTEKKLGEKTAKELELIEISKLDKIIRINRKFNQDLKNLRDEDIQNALDAAEKFEKEFNKALQDRFERDMARIKALTEANKQAGKDQLEDDKKYTEEKKKLFEDLANELQTFTFTIFTSGIEKQKNAIQEQIDLLEQKKQKDIEVANQQFTNAQQRAAEIAVIESRAQAQRETLQRRQRDLDVKRAEFEKAAAVAKIIQETAINVVKYIANPFLAGLAAAVGAAQLATVIAQPIPRYKHGKNVNDLYEGPAIVGDGGRKEAIVRENGSVEITPDTPTLTYVKKRDIVLPDTGMLADLVVSGALGSKLVERQTTAEKSNLEAAIYRMEGSVVMAIKKIPQPVIRVENLISRRVLHGDSSNQYLNRNLQA